MSAVECPCLRAKTTVDDYDVRRVITIAYIEPASLVMLGAIVDVPLP